MTTDQCDSYPSLMDIFSASEDLVSQAHNPVLSSLQVCLLISILAFLVSTWSDNMSQVDKMWSITPIVYTWMAVCDTRTLIMFLLTALWGTRLSYNFYRRGGYTWPPWEGEEDYRWHYVRHEGIFLKALTDRRVWVVFNLVFISLYQNFLLWLIASPSLVIWSMVRSPKCRGSLGSATEPWNRLDWIVTISVLFFMVLESIADNQQLQFQTKKRSITSRDDKRTDENGEIADGFCQSGLFSIVRKPNYASEQAIWISFYFFTVSATSGRILYNWSFWGWVSLVILFQASGWLTEKITAEKYPKYREYMSRVPLYLPTIPILLGAVAKKVKQS